MNDTAECLLTGDNSVRLLGDVATAKYQRRILTRWFGYAKQKQFRERADFKLAGLVSWISMRYENLYFMSPVTPP